MYVLGARAHALVRTSNVIVDGPLKSGLLFECAKNLALSGVGTITILTDNAGEEEENDQIHKLHSIYHNEKLDDLGNAYTRAAIGETGYDDILQYLQRLNPSLSVSTISRSAFATKCATRASLERTLGVTPATTVYLCIDRPESTQLTTNSLCRTLQIPFVSTETAGLYGRIFCDFGPDFVVLDPDGGTPRQTLLDRVEVISNNFTTTSDDLTNTLDLMIFCVPKKQGQGLRIVQDFRELNQNSHIDKYSMKEITECIGDIGRANSTIFTTLDLTSGFWQMQLDEDSQKLTAFTIPNRGQFHWITSPMGLLGCPASFQRLMEQVIHKCIYPL